MAGQLHQKKDFEEPNSDGLQPSGDGLQPNSDGLQPTSDGLLPNSKLYCNELFGKKINLAFGRHTVPCPGWPGFKRVAAVVVGDPPVSFKSFSQDFQFGFNGLKRIEQQITIF